MNLKNDFIKIKYYLKRYGFFSTLKKVLKKIFRIKENRKSNQEQYINWINKNEPSNDELEKQKKTKFEYEPKISVVVPMYNTKERFLEELVNSLRSQTYSNWELCLADGSQCENENFKKYYESDKRIKYKFLNENKGISENTNEAIKMADGEYIGFLDHDDLISDDCLFEVVKSLNETCDKTSQNGLYVKNTDIKSNYFADFIYTDEDKIDDETGERFEPYFKTDFSPETLECNNYITHFVVVKKELLKNVGNLNSKFNGAQDFDFILRATKNSKKIIHISKILYHWRVHRDSTANVADSKPYAYEAGVKVIDEYLKSSNKSGTVEFGQDVPGIYKIKYDVIGNPRVSIIIPNKDNVKILKNCIESIIKNTTYNNYEIVIIENNSEKKETFEYYKKIVENNKIKILNYNKETILDSFGEKNITNEKYSNNEVVENKNEFNYSKLINFGVQNVDGEYILQLNNDTKLLTKDWLEQFIGYAQNKEIGAIGARLYYEDKTIQHAGIAIGISGIAGNELVNLHYGTHAYFGREAATRNISAVTGACLFSRRELYQEVGYMDENNFKVAFNDVDFCLKILEKGYRNLYIPYIELIHYESKTRGYELSEEKQNRFDNECTNFKNKWKKYIDYDPYYNINFTRDTCNFDIK